MNLLSFVDDSSSFVSHSKSQRYFQETQKSKSFFNRKHNWAVSLKWHWLWGYRASKCIDGPTNTVECMHTDVERRILLAPSGDLNSTVFTTDRAIQYSSYVYWHALHAQRSPRKYFQCLESCIYLKMILPQKWSLVWDTYVIFLSWWTRASIVKVPLCCHYQPPCNFYFSVRCTTWDTGDNSKMST